MAVLAAAARFNQITSCLKRNVLRRAYGRRITLRKSVYGLQVQILAIYTRNVIMLPFWVEGH